MYTSFKYKIRKKGNFGQTMEQDRGESKRGRLRKENRESLTSLIKKRSKRGRPSKANRESLISLIKKRRKRGRPNKCYVKPLKNVIMQAETRRGRPLKAKERECRDEEVNTRGNIENTQSTGRRSQPARSCKKY